MIYGEILATQKDGWTVRVASTWGDARDFGIAGEVHLPMRDFKIAGRRGLLTRFVAVNADALNRLARQGQSVE